MASVNRVIIVGHLGRDPEIRYMPSGEAVANLSIATTEKWKDKQGQQQESTEWHRVNFFGRIAEVCGEYLTKGSLVYVEGGLRTRKYTDKEGVERYVTEIKGDRMQMLGGGSSGERPAQQSRQQPKQQSGGGNHFDDLDDDIPF